MRWEKKKKAFLDDPEFFSYVCIHVHAMFKF